MRLPVAKEAALTARVQHNGGAAPVDPQPSLSGIRVVLVDDEADVRGAVSGLLERMGATVLALESGASIDSAIADFRPDVLVLDIGMPGEDGYTLIRRVRRLPRSAGGAIPAISLTAHVRDEDRRHAITLGFQAHLAKPVDIALLVSTIRTLVGEAVGADAGGSAR